MTEIAGIAVYEESIMTTGKEVAERFKGMIMPRNLKVSPARGSWAGAMKGLR